MVKKYLLLLSLLLSAIAVAEDITVYRWVDENGVVHYEQNQPIEKEYSEIKIKPNKPSLHPSQNSVTDKAREDGNNSDAAKRCAIAKDNLAKLSGLNKVEVDEGNGKTRVLSDKEKRQQLELTQKEIDIFCKINN